MKTILKKATAALCSLSLVLAIAPVPAFADSSEIVTLGADLSQEQKDTVLSFFGLDENSLSNVEVITVTNKDEHEYCDDSIPSSVTGSRTLSCSYIQPTTSGGIQVKTANLTYVTSSTLYNALQTAGVENCNLVVTAPFEVSGTGALTGVFMAYKEQGKTIDSEKADAAVDEMYTTAGMQQEYGDDIAKVISDVKSQALSGAADMTDAQIKQLIKDKAAEYGVNITDDDINSLVALIDKLKKLDYDADAFSDTLQKATDALNNLTAQSEGFVGWLQGLMSSISGFFSGLFSGGSTSDGASIMDKLNTDVFKVE